MEPWWFGIAEAAVAALAAVLIAVAGALTPMIRAWIKQKTKLNDALVDEVLGRKLDEGAVNIIRAAEKRLQLEIERRYATGDLPSEQKMIIEKSHIIDTAKPILQREFKETLDHFGKTPRAVEEFLAARVDRALGD